jgi:tRNA nucleotidyltransferase (CCA-adding enzyme)
LFANNTDMTTDATRKEPNIWFSEFEAHLLRDEKPSVYFTSLINEGGFPDEYPFSMILELKRIQQQKEHHPEGDVFNHTMQVTDIASTVKHKSKDPREFMWAALLHDLGKIPATKLRKGKITAYDHDKEGEKLARSFLQHCTEDETFISRVCALVRWHMQVLFVAHNMPFADLPAMLRSVDANEIALLTLCDRLGRGEKTQKAIETENKNIDLFLARCARVQQVPT